MGAFGFGVAAARAFDLGLHATQVACGHQPRVKLHFGEAVTFLAALHDVFGQFLLGIGDARLVVGFGDSGDDAEFGGVACFAGGKVFVQRLVAHRLDPAKEVEFKGAAGKGEVVHGANARPAGASEVARGAAAGDAAVGSHCWQKFAALDAVLGFGDFGVERGGFEVVVVRECFFNEFL